MLQRTKDTALFEGHERILNRIRTGKMVYFKNSFKEIAFKYIPGELGRLGKYFAKFYGCDEYEIAYWSKVVCEGESEGLIITKSDYNNHHPL